MGGRRQHAVVAAICMMLGVAPVVVQAQAQAAAGTRPVITSVSRTVVAAQKSSLLTIRGRHLRGTEFVKFGKYYADGFRVRSDRRIVVRTPSRKGDATRYVRVITRHGTSRTTSRARVTFVMPPQLGRIEPTDGPTSGARVRITGRDLREVIAVTANGVHASAVRRNRDGSVSATLPRHAPGVVTVAVRTKWGDTLAPTPVSFRHVAAPVVTGLDQTDGPTAGGQSLTLTGRNLSVRHVAYVGGVPARVESGAADGTVLTVITPPHPAGAVQVTVRSSGGTSTTSEQTRYDYIAHPRTWTDSGRLLVSGRGYIRAVSCPDVHTCMAIDPTSIARRVDGVWSAPVSLAPSSELLGMSCPTADYCVVVDGSSSTITVSADTHTTMPAPSGLSAVDCAAVGECVAATSTGVAVLSGGTWGKVHDLAGRVRAVACPEIDRCVAVTDQTIFRWDGVTWDDGIVAPVDPATRLADVDCLSQTSCVAVALDGNAMLFDGTWHAAEQLFGSRNGRAVSCTATGCVALNVFGDTTVYTPSAGWRRVGALARSDFTTIGPFIDCLSTTSCLAGDRTGLAAHFDGDAWASAVSAMPGNGFGESVACWAPRKCMVSDDEGNVYTSDGETLSEPTRVLYAGSGRNSLACRSQAFCILVSRRGESAVFDGTRWSRPIASPSFSAVSCPGFGPCLAVGASVTYAYTNAEWQRRADHPAGVFPTSLSCPSSTFCALAGNNLVTTYDGTSWLRAPVAAAGGLASCADAGRCVYLTATGQYSRLAGGRWSTLQSRPGLNNPVALSCERSGFCAVVAGNGNVRTLSGDRWLTGGAIASPFPQAISCPDQLACVAVTDTGVTRSG